jgi:hypothetical protein
LKALGGKPPFQVFTRWQSKVESGLMIIGITEPDRIHG